MKKRLLSVAENLVNTFKREPTVVRLALMGLLASLAIWPPEQLAQIDLVIDRVTPALLLLLGADLRGKVTPTDAPRKTVTVPLDLPAGPSGAF